MSELLKDKDSDNTAMEWLFARAREYPLLTAQEEQAAIQSYKSESNQSSSSATLGDLLKEQMKSD